MSQTAWPYDRVGTGEAPWIWLHGWGQDRQSLAAVANRVSDLGIHRLYDQPGFGACPPLPASAGTEDYARALVDQLPPGQPSILVGHSFGCRVAVQAARLAPDRLKALIFIAGAGPKRPRSLRWRLKAWGLKLLGKLAGAADAVGAFGLKDRYRQRFGSADYKAAGTLRGTFIKVVSEDLGPISAEIQCPTLLLYGELDREAPPILGQIYARRMQQAALHILPGYDHFDILSRGQYQVEALIRAFTGSLKP